MFKRENPHTLRANPPLFKRVKTALQLKQKGKKAWQDSNPIIETVPVSGHCKAFSEGNLPSVTGLL